MHCLSPSQLYNHKGGSAPTAAGLTHSCFLVNNYITLEVVGVSSDRRRSIDNPFMHKTSLHILVTKDQSLFIFNTARNTQMHCELNAEILNINAAGTQLFRAVKSGSPRPSPLSPQEYLYLLIINHNIKYCSAHFYYFTKWVYLAYWCNTVCIMLSRTKFLSFFFSLSLLSLQLLKPRLCNKFLRGIYIFFYSLSMYFYYSKFKYYRQLWRRGSRIEIILGTGSAVPDRLRHAALQTGLPIQKFVFSTITENRQKLTLR